MRSFYAALLQDEEGKLGVLSFESREPIVFDQETRDLVQILQNQATVAVRNAQLYQQMPLVGIWKPLLAQKRKFESAGVSKRIGYAGKRRDLPGFLRIADIYLAEFPNPAPQGVLMAMSVERPVVAMKPNDEAEQSQAATLVGSE